ncbi:MAG: FmdB family zinc ribbon protein [Steroidobacteraceae bacterium]|jgi:putative FmdB family regulatory protein
MPFYEYECSNCRYYVEVMQRLRDARLTKCPSCGKNTLKKLISAPVFRLKGSGWYETDFKSDQEQKRNLAGSEPEPPPAAPAADKAAAGQDAKAETPAAPKSESSAQKSEPAAEKNRQSGRSVPAKTKPAPAASKGARASKGAATPKLAGKRPAVPRAAATRSPSRARAKGARGRGGR